MADPDAGKVNLLGLFAQHRTEIDGKWEMSADGLLCQKGGILLFNYSPPEEYDVHIEFTQQTGRDASGVICPLSGGAIMWSAGGWGNRVIGFTSVDGGGGWHAVNARTVDGVLKDGKRNSATIRIRRKSVQAVFNGELVAEIADYGKGLSAGNDEVGGKRVIGLAIDPATTAIIHKLQVTEVVGKGEIVSPK